MYYFPDVVVNFLFLTSTNDQNVDEKFSIHLFVYCQINPSKGFFYSYSYITILPILHGRLHLQHGVYQITKIQNSHFFSTCFVLPKVNNFCIHIFRLYEHESF